MTMATSVAGARVIGLVENMSGVVCSTCGKTLGLYNTGSRAEALAAAHGVPFLGSVPYDARLAVAADLGEPFVARYAEAPASQALADVAGHLQHYLPTE